MKNENKIGSDIINNSSIGIQIMCVISQNLEVMHIRGIHSLLGNQKLMSINYNNIIIQFAC